MIPCADPRAGYLARRGQIDAAIAEVLNSGRYILGESVTAFEQEFSRYLGVRNAVAVANGTDALHLAIRACGIGPGDEVITVSHTAVATVAAIEMAGARPVLVDIDPGSYTLDTGLLGDALSERTKAIVPVHLYGHPVDMAPLLRFARERGLRVIEDCAQAHGARSGGRRVGSLGDISAFSFYPTKNLGALGDAGVVATDDEELAGRVRLLREYGWGRRNESLVAGWNSRMDELQAAVLRVKLRYLDQDNAERARIADLYRERLVDAGLVLPTERPGDTHVFHLFVVRSPARDALQERLLRLGVSALVHYPVPVHLQPAYRGRVLQATPLGETEAAAREVLSLPMFPELTAGELERVTEAVLAREVVS